MALFQPLNQIRLTNVAVVRLKSHGYRFEVACYKNKVLNWRSGIEGDLSEVLQTPAVFHNVHKGELAKIDALKKAFGTADDEAICRRILEKGDIQISEKERRVALDAIFKDVSTWVTELCVNPQTGLPLTQSLVEGAMKEVGFGVKLGESAKKQALKAIEILHRTMPLQIARSLMRIRISGNTHQIESILAFLKDVCDATIEDETPRVTQKEEKDDKFEKREEENEEKENEEEENDEDEEEEEEEEETEDEEEEEEESEEEEEEESEEEKETERENRNTSSKTIAMSNNKSTKNKNTDNDDNTNNNDNKNDEVNIPITSPIANSSHSSDSSSTSNSSSSSSSCEENINNSSSSGNNGNNSSSSGNNGNNNSSSGNNGNNNSSSSGNNGNNNSSSSGNNGNNNSSSGNNGNNNSSGNNGNNNSSSSGNNGNNSSSRSSYYCVVFLCDPSHYRRLDEFVLESLKPPGLLQLLSSNVKGIAVASMTSNSSSSSFSETATEVLSSTATVSPIASNENEPHLHLSSSTDESNKKKENENNGEASLLPTSSSTSYLFKFKCTTCKSSWETVKEYRTHCQSEWHGFNLKKKIKHFPPVTEEEFEEISFDIRNGFLAVDS